MTSPTPSVPSARAQHHRSVEQHVVERRAGPHGSRVVTSAEAATAANATRHPRRGARATAAGPNQRRRDGDSAHAVCAVRVSSSRPTSVTPPSRPAANGRIAISARTLPPDSSLIAENRRTASTHGSPSTRLPPSAFQRSMHWVDSPAPTSWLVTWSAAKPSTTANSTAAPTSNRCCRSVIQAERRIYAAAVRGVRVARPAGSREMPQHDVLQRGLGERLVTRHEERDRLPVGAGKGREDRALCGGGGRQRSDASRVPPRRWRAARPGRR